MASTLTFVLHPPGQLEHGYVVGLILPAVQATPEGDGYGVLLGGSLAVTARTVLLLGLPVVLAQAHNSAAGSYILYLDHFKYYISSSILTALDPP